MAMMQKQGRFEVYEGDSHPPLSPPNQQQPGAVMDQHLSRPSSLAAAVTDRFVIHNVFRVACFDVNWDSSINRCN